MWIWGSGVQIPLAAPIFMTIKPKADNIVIRPAAAADAEAIARINIETWKASYRGLVEDKILDGMAVSPLRLKRVIEQIVAQNDRRITLVACENEAPIGFAEAGMGLEGSEGYDCLLQGLYILPRLQGRGIGKKLIRDLLSFLVPQKLRNLILWTVKGAKSCGFYESLVGQALGKEKPMNTPGGEFLCTIVAYAWPDISTLSARLEE